MRTVYRISNVKYSRDLSGGGAAKFGGRWNPRGTYVLYTAASASLAMLEWLAHARDRDLDDVYCLITISIPDAPIHKIDLATLPENWRSFPPPAVLQNFGATMVASNEWFALEVPSVLMPLDYNLVIHVNHPLLAKTYIEDVQELEADQRLLPYKKGAGPA